MQLATKFHFGPLAGPFSTAGPGSVLWLLESEADINGRLVAYAEANGVARERLIWAPKQANAFHLARYALADLCGDTNSSTAPTPPPPTPCGWGFRC